MLTYLLTLLGLPLLCVLWILFQQWLAHNDPDHKGYQAGCGGCTRTCGDAQDVCERTIQSSDRNVKHHPKKVS